MINILLEIIFRVIPECLLFIFSGYAFSKYRVQGKRYLLSALLLSAIGYAIARLLPIEFGVAQVLSIIACAALLVLINHIPVQKAVASSFGVMILGFITDIIAVLITVIIKGLDIKSAFSNSEVFDLVFKNDFEQLVYGAMSLGIMAIVLLTIYFMAKKRGKLKDVPIGKSVG